MGFFYLAISFVSTIESYISFKNHIEGNYPFIIYMMPIIIISMDFMVKQISYAYDKNTLFIGMEIKINKRKY
jgi:hypothetical protein